MPNKDMYIVYRVRHKNLHISWTAQFKLHKLATFIAERYSWDAEKFHSYATAITKNANKTNCTELIWKDECVLRIHRILISLLDYHNLSSMECDAQDVPTLYTPKPTNTYGAEERCASNLGWLSSRRKLTNNRLLAASQTDIKGSDVPSLRSWWLKKGCLVFSISWRQEGHDYKTLHQLGLPSTLMECTFPPLLFPHRHPFYCLKSTWLDGVKDLWRMQCIHL